jgi:hypothetical protein
MTCASIDRFMGECREWARVRPAITPAHISFIEQALVNAHRAAAESPNCFGTMWGCIETAITRSNWDVKAKLEEMGRIGDAFRAEFKRHLPPQSTSVV